MNIANRTEHKSGNNQKKSVPYDTYGMRYFIFYMESLLWRIQYLLKGQRDNRTVPLFYPLDRRIIQSRGNQILPQRRCGYQGCISNQNPRFQSSTKSSQNIP